MRTRFKDFSIIPVSSLAVANGVNAAALAAKLAYRSAMATWIFNARFRNGRRADVDRIRRRRLSGMTPLTFRIECSCRSSRR